MYPSGHKVKLNPAALEDEALKSNHHIIERILKEGETGSIRETDMEKSKPESIYYWVQFYFAVLLLHERHVLAA